MQHIIPELKLDATYPRPVDTSYILAVMHEPKKLGLLDENGLIKYQFDQQPIYNYYESLYKAKL